MRTYADLFPAKTTMAPQSTLENIRWLGYDAFRLEIITGTTIAFMGDMPLICHKSVASTNCLEFIRFCGLHPPTRLQTYGTFEEGVALAQQSVSSGQRLAYFYPPPHALDFSENLVISSKFYGELNDKSRIPDFVDNKYLPNRRLVPIDHLDTLINNYVGYPVYLKASLEGANGACFGVKYCYDELSWKEAINWFLNNDLLMNGLVIEDAVDIVTCWCLGVSILDHQCTYLGGSIQLFNKPAEQTGNRIDPACPEPYEAVLIAMDISQRAQKMGFRSVAGFDIGIDAAGKLYVFDLNFRLNASTNQLILHESMTWRIGSHINQTWQIESYHSIDSLINQLEPFAKKGQFVVSRFFDRKIYNDFHHGDVKNIISGFIIGKSTEEIDEINKALDRKMTEKGDGEIKC